MKQLQSSPGLLRKCLLTASILCLTLFLTACPAPDQNGGSGEPLNAPVVQLPISA